jgi:hypothetical protein
MYEVIQNDIVVVQRERFAELERKEERIETVRRLYESGQFYCLDTALSVLGIKIRGAEKIGLTDGDQSP